MNAKLYVGNLNYSVTADQLKDLFSQVGKVVDAILIRDRHTDRSKGFGFVEFEKEEDAEKAIEKFHDQEYEGRQMIVNKARPRREN